MYAPTRGGARGGAAEFSWDKVKESKDREFYLGNSVAAPTGRWQDGRDINWYNKDASASASAKTAAEERREELRRIKEAETAALYAKLGKPPPSTLNEEVKVGERLASGSRGDVRSEVTGPNSAPQKANGRKWGKGEDVPEEDKRLARKFARDEVRRRRGEADRKDEDDEDSRRDRRREDRQGDHHSRSQACRHGDRDRISHHRHSRRHRDEAESRRHRHHSRSRSTSRSRSKSPDSSSRRRNRDEDEDRRDKCSSSRKHRGRRGEGSSQSSSSHGDRGSSRRQDRRD